MKAIAITLLAFAATAALANEAGDELANRSVVQSVASRQAVQQAYEAARRSGTLPVTSEAASLERTEVPANEQARLEARQQAREAARQRVIHELI